MALSLSALRLVVRTWLVSASGLADTKVIFEDDPGTRPAKPYMVLKLLSVETEGEDEVTAGNGTVTHFGHRAATVVLQVYGTNAGNTLEEVRKGQYRQALQLSARAAGFTVYAAGPNRNIALLLDTGIEERAQMEIEIRFADSDAATSGEGYIDNLTGVGTIGDVDATVDIT